MKLSLLAGKRKLKFFFFSIGYNKKVKFPNFVQWVKIKRQTAHLYFKKYKKSKQRAGKKKRKKNKGRTEQFRCSPAFIAGTLSLNFRGISTELFPGKQPNKKANKTIKIRKKYIRTAYHVLFFFFSFLFLNSADFSVYPSRNS